MSILYTYVLVTSLTTPQSFHSVCDPSHQVNTDEKDLGHCCWRIHANCPSMRPSDLSPASWLIINMPLFFPFR